MTGIRKISTDLMHSRWQIAHDELQTLQTAFDISDEQLVAMKRALYNAYNKGAQDVERKWFKSVKGRR
jgi:hypothetical protein